MLRDGSGCLRPEVAHAVRLFRRLNGPVVLLPNAFVTIQDLQQVFDPRGGAWIERKYVPSLLAAIGGVIEKHLRTIGFLDAGEAAPADAVVGDSGTVTTGSGSECGRCGAFAVVRTEGCDLCTACGYSTCG